MLTTKTLKWFWSSIPRAPQKPGVLMQLYYLWQEYFTPVGRALAALMFFSLMAGFIPGFWMAWIFCGFLFLLFLTMVPTLYLTSRKNRVEVESVEIEPVFEGENARLKAVVHSQVPIDAVSLGAFRLDPNLFCIENPPVFCNGRTLLECSVKTRCRGAFKIRKVAVVVPEILGMLRVVQKLSENEILVFPKMVKIRQFHFLTSGASGLAFSQAMNVDKLRGLDFAGVREYREGDSLRDLHHKAFARYGRPFTKEYESERGSGITLFLDVSARTLQEKTLVEPLIRLASGIGFWLMERSALGRFFVGDEEVSLCKDDGAKSFLQALARIPAAKIVSKDKAEKKWNPAVKPMGPVLRLGVNLYESPLIQKQIVIVSSKNSFSEKSSEKVMFLEAPLDEACL